MARPLMTCAVLLMVAACGPSTEPAREQGVPADDQARVPALAPEPVPPARKRWDHRFADHEPTSACPLLFDGDRDGHDDLVLTQARRRRGSTRIGPFRKRYDRDPEDDPFVIVALSTDDGSLAWEKAIGTRAGLPFLDLYALDGDLLWVAGNWIRRVDPTSADARWEVYADQDAPELATTDGGMRLWIDTMHYLDASTGESHGQLLHGVRPPRGPGRLTPPEAAAPDPDLERLVGDGGHVGPPGRVELSPSMVSARDLDFDESSDWRAIEVHRGRRDLPVFGVDPPADGRRVGILRDAGRGDDLWLVHWRASDSAPRWAVKLGRSLTSEALQRRAPSASAFLPRVHWRDEDLLLVVDLGETLELRRYDLSDGRLRWSVPTTWTGCVSAGNDLLVADDVRRLSDGSTVLDLPWRK